VKLEQDVLPIGKTGYAVQLLGILGHVEIVVHSILLSCSMIVWKQSWHWVMMTFACKRRWRLWILLGCKGV